MNTWKLDDGFNDGGLISLLNYILMTVPELYAVLKIPENLSVVSPPETDTVGDIMENAPVLIEYRYDGEADNWIYAGICTDMTEADLIVLDMVYVRV